MICKSVNLSVVSARLLQETEKTGGGGGEVCSQWEGRAAEIIFF